MWGLKTNKRAETDQSMKAVKSAGSMQSALVEAGVVKQSQVNAVRKETSNHAHQYYVATASPDAIKQFKLVLATAIKLFDEKRTPEALQDWREIELMIEIEQMYASSKTHGFVSHLVASFAAYPEVVRPPKTNANGLKDPVSRVPLTHRTAPIDNRILQGLLHKLDTDQFQKAHKAFFSLAELPVGSPHSQTVISGLTFRALKRWVSYQVDVQQNDHIVKLMRPR